MQAIINFNDYADISSFKKILETFKGVKDFKILNNSDDAMSDEEYEKKLDELLNKSLQQSIEGKVTPYNSEEMRKEFKAKIKNAG